MEAMMAAPVENGQQLKSPIEVVSNVGLLSAFKKSSTTTVSTRVQQLHDQLETARQENDGLWEEVKTLKAQTQVSQETIDNMKWSNWIASTVSRFKLSLLLLCSLRWFPEEPEYAPQRQVQPLDHTLPSRSSKNQQR
jgi:hypothetical protein